MSNILFLRISLLEGAVVGERGKGGRGRGGGGREEGGGGGDAA